MIFTGSLTLQSNRTMNSPQLLRPIADHRSAGLMSARLTRSGRPGQVNGEPIIAMNGPTHLHFAINLGWKIKGQTNYPGSISSEWVSSSPSTQLQMAATQAASRLAPSV
jgi:hypothetical protein